MMAEVGPKKNTKPARTKNIFTFRSERIRMPFCRPLAAFAVSKRFTWVDRPFEAEIHLANDTMTPLEGARLTATVYGSDLAVLWEKEYDGLSAGRNSHNCIDAIKVETKKK